MSPEPAGVTPALEKICTEIVGPNASTVDRDGAFPEHGVKALGEAGLLGAVSAPEVGGLGLGFRGAATHRRPSHGRTQRRSLRCVAADGGGIIGSRRSATGLPQ